MNGRISKSIRRNARKLATVANDMSATDFKLKRTIDGALGPFPIISATVHYVNGSFRYWCSQIKASQNGRTPSKSNWRSDVK